MCVLYMPPYGEGVAHNLAVCGLVFIHKVMECDTPLEKLYHKKKKGEGCVFKDVSKYKNLFCFFLITKFQFHEILSSLIH